MKYYESVGSSEWMASRSGLNFWAGWVVFPAELGSDAGNFSCSSHGHRMEVRKERDGHVLPGILAMDVVVGPSI